MNLEARLETHPLGPVLTSMPGVGVRTAIKVLTIVGDGSAFPTAAHLASYAGLAPVPRRSGTSIKGETRSRRGHHALKSALFLSAFASLADPISRAYYDSKHARGKRHNAALICLARRRTDVLFDDDRSYGPRRAAGRPPPDQAWFAVICALSPMTYVSEGLRSVITSPLPRLLTTLVVCFQGAAAIRSLLEHLLPPAPSVVADVGGGPGRDAQWLATSGYSVTLIDPVAALVQFARERALHSAHSFNAIIGDARSLELDDESVDAVVMMGPLYHLPDRAERQRAVDEGFRVLRPGGTLLAAAISRFTALLDTARVGALDVTRTARAHKSFLHDGRFDSQTGFTRSYFHRPDELAEELRSAGLTSVRAEPVPDHADGVDPRVA